MYETECTFRFSLVEDFCVAEDCVTTNGYKDFELFC